MKRKEVLETAIKYVMHDRNKDYQDPEDNFADIAHLWEFWLGVPITPTDVAIMTGMIKIARMKGNLYNMDNFIDLAGYAACGAECAEKQQEREYAEAVRKVKEPVGNLWSKDLLKGTHLDPDGTIVPDAEMEGVSNRIVGRYDE